MDDGSRVPAALTQLGPVLNVGLQATVPGTDAQVSIAETSADGSFVLPLSLAGKSGQFAISITTLPLGYDVKSMQHGAVNLLRAPLTVTPTSMATEIRVVLSKTPSGGVPVDFKVSGRIKTRHESAVPPEVSLQSKNTDANGLPVVRFGKAKVKADGTFEVAHVPPGSYVAWLAPGAKLGDFAVAGRDVAGLEFTVENSAMPILITNVPFGSSTAGLRPSASTVPGPTVPVVPQPGQAAISVSQAGNYVLGREGALSFFRLEQAGVPVEERRMDDASLVFNLAPGAYDLRGYSRPCDGNCARISAPVAQCTVSFTVVAGQVLYAERTILEGAMCTFRLTDSPH